MSGKSDRLPPLEDGILRAMRAIDNQIAREMQRSPAELEAKGVQKWEPYKKRVELITAFVLDSMSDELVELDSLLVMAEAMTKALLLYVQDLERDGLGKLRTSYCTEAMEKIENDAYRGLQVLKDVPALS